MRITLSTEAFQRKNFRTLGSHRSSAYFVLRILLGILWETSGYLLLPGKDSYLSPQLPASSSIFWQALWAVLDQRVLPSFHSNWLQIRKDQAPFQQELGRGSQKCWLRTQLPSMETANRSGSFCKRELGALLRTTYIGTVVVTCHRA